MYNILSIANVADIANEQKLKELKIKQDKLKSFLQNYNNWHSEYGIECFVLVDKQDNKGNYYLSNYGTLLSFYYSEWQIVQWYPNETGRPRVKINGKNYFVSRLVACYFLDFDITDKSKDIHHKDRNVKNNYYGNLEIIDKIEHNHYHNKLRKLQRKKEKENENNT